MPLYEYQCLNCERVHEVLQSFSAPAPQECPECQGPLKKQVSLSSFSLKGTGWYTTDYKKSNAPKESPASTHPNVAPQTQDTPAQKPSPSNKSDSSAS